VIIPILNDLSSHLEYIPPSDSFTTLAIHLNIIAKTTDIPNIIIHLPATKLFILKTNPDNNDKTPAESITEYEAEFGTK
jgi:hypothetical protein